MTNKSRLLSTVSLGYLVSAATIPTAVLAQTPPDPIYSGLASYDGIGLTQLTTAGTGASSYCVPMGGCGFGSVTLGANGADSIGSVSASTFGSTSGNAPPETGTASEVIFYFEVLGPGEPNSGGMVTVDITSQGTTSESGAGGLAQASVNAFVACSSGSGICNSGSLPSFSGTYALSLAPGELSGITDLASGSGLGGPSTWSSSVTSTIYLTPAELEAGDRLVFGPDVAAVPEPETYALLGAGLLLVGTVGRRRLSRGNPA